MSVISHPAFHHHPDAAHALHLGLPPGVPILSLVPGLFTPAYAFLAHVPMPRRSAGGNSNGVVAGAANGTGGSGSAGGAGGANGGGAGGGGGGNGADRVSNGGVGNGEALAGGAAIGGGGLVGGLGGGNGVGGSGESGGSVAPGGTGDNGPLLGRVRVQASSLPSEPRVFPRKSQELVAPAYPSGSIADNREEVMAGASVLERRRRAEGRTTCSAKMVPEIREPECAVDHMGYRDLPRGKFDEEEAFMRGVRGGWHLLERENEAIPPAGLAGGISNASRSDNGWTPTPSSLTSSPVAAGMNGGWEEGDSTTDSATGSINGSMVGDACRVEEAPWSVDLASSVGVVTDLVLPCHSAAMGCGSIGQGWDGAMWEDDDDDEEEREMDAALEVRRVFHALRLCLLFF